MQYHVGNRKIQNKIAQRAEKGELPHALLITGPKYTGKFSFCTNLAFHLLGKNATPPNVVLVDFLYQEGLANNEEAIQTSTFDQSHRKKKKKKTDTIGVDDIESATKHLYETIDGKYKVVCIRDIERMTAPASNTFLKMLEEPPQKTLFLLTTSQKEKVLPTIISRCMQESFSLLSPLQAQNIIENTSFSQKEKKILHLLGAGREELLQKMINDSEYFSAKKELYEKIQTIQAASPLSKMDIAESIAKKDLSYIVEMLSVIMLTIRPEVLLCHKNVVFLDLVESTLSGLLGNGNKRMLLERLFWNMPCP